MFKEVSVAFGFIHKDGADDIMYAAPLISDLLLIGFNSSKYDTKKSYSLDDDQLVRDFHRAWILLKTKLVDATKICKLSKWRLEFCTEEAVFVNHVVLDDVPSS